MCFSKSTVASLNVLYCKLKAGKLHFQEADISMFLPFVADYRLIDYANSFRLFFAAPVKPLQHAGNIRVGYAALHNSADVLILPHYKRGTAPKNIHIRHQAHFF